MTRIFRLNVGWRALRGTVPHALAAAGVMTVCTAAHADSRATLTLRGVVHRTVTVAFADGGASADGAQFPGPARTLRISEESNVAGRYRMYLEAGADAAAAAFDGRPVRLLGGRALLDAAGQGGGSVQRSRTLALGAAARPYVLVVSVP